MMNSETYRWMRDWVDFCQQNSSEMKDNKDNTEYPVPLKYKDETIGFVMNENNEVLITDEKQWKEISKSLEQPVGISSRAVGKVTDGRVTEMKRTEDVVFENMKSKDKFKQLVDQIKLELHERGTALNYMKYLNEKDTKAYSVEKGKMKMCEYLLEVADNIDSRDDKLEHE